VEILQVSKLFATQCTPNAPTPYSPQPNSTRSAPFALTLRTHPNHNPFPRPLPPTVDELIREVTINCAERGLLLLRVRDEMRMTIAAYQVGGNVST